MRMSAITTWLILNEICISSCSSCFMMGDQHSLICSLIMLSLLLFSYALFYSIVMWNVLHCNSCYLSDIITFLFPFISFCGTTSIVFFIELLTSKKLNMGAYFFVILFYSGTTCPALERLHTIMWILRINFPWLAECVIRSLKWFARQWKRGYCIPSSLQWWGCLLCNHKWLNKRLMKNEETVWQESYRSLQVTQL